MPGFWKTPTDTAQYPNATASDGYTSSQSVGSVFWVPFPALTSATLPDGSAFQGRSTDQGGAEILLSTAIAVALNSANGNAGYPEKTSVIIAEVNTASLVPALA